MSQSYSFPMGSKEGSLDRNLNPGPTQYDDTQGQKLTHDHSPEWTFGKSGRPDIDGEGQPGPGTYDYDQKDKKIKGIQFSVQSKNIEQIRSPSKESQNIGPGSYDIQNMNKSPNYTFGKKYQQQIDNSLPGPGQYEKQQFLEETLSKSKNKSNVPFGSKKERNSNQQSNNLGPGCYNANDNVTKYQNPSFGFSKLSKDGNINAEKSPGPGYYQSSDIKQIGDNHSQKVTIGKRPKTAVINNTPGPGQYYQKTDFSPQKSNPITSKTPRQSDKKITQSTHHLGPGCYDPKDFLTKSKIIAVNFQNQAKRPSVISKDESLKPGPGKYEPHIRQSSKSFTIGKRIQNKQQNQQPGPGEYEVKYDKIKDKVQAFDFGKSVDKSNNRLSTSKSNNYLSQIGPGTYYKEEEFGKSATKVSLRGRPSTNQNTNSPGPGTYEIPPNEVQKYKSPSFSINKAKEEVNQNKQEINYKYDDKPGPGTYQKQDDFGKNVPSYTIGQKRDQQSNDQSPGPGFYDANESQTKCKSISYKQSDCKRNDIVSKEHSTSPGPGTYYNENNDIGKNTKSFTIATKLDNNQRLDSPGPGQYDVKDTQVKESIKQYSISKSSRQNIVSTQQQNIPGPGTYTNESKSIGKNVQSFTIAGKSVSNDRNNSPGPGQYDVKDTQVKESVRTFIMSNTKRQNIVSNEVNDRPGPCNYDISNQNKGPSYSFYHKREDKIDNRSPGPGTYDSQATLIKDKVISYKISQTKRNDIVNKDVQSKPGPGQYDDLLDNRSIANNTSRKALITGKSNELSNNNSPGPGHYQPSDNLTRNKTQSMIFSGNEQRTQIVSKQQQQNPGPGSYEELNKSEFGNNGPKFTIQGKSQQEERSKSPGPGHYNDNQNIIKTQSPSYKISNTKRDSLVEKILQNMPGPGNYAQSSLFGSGGPKYTMTQKKEQIIKTDIPGPGQYDPLYNQSKDKIVTHKISNSQYRGIVNDSEYQKPGPGQYDSPTKFGNTGISYTINTKKQDTKPNDIPGPGHYNANDNLIKSSSQQCLISKSQRNDIVSKHAKDMPGPGNYDNQNNINEFGKNSVSYTIQSKRDDISRKDSPGPGQYDAIDNQSRYQSPQHTISKTNRVDIVSQDKQQQPGPGYYELKQNFGSDAKSFQMRGKHEQNDNTNSPGPGYYEPNHNIIKDKVKVCSIKQSSSKKNSLSYSNNNIGPGYYNPNNNNKVQSFTISGKPSDNNRNDSPGPGKYDPNESLIKFKSPSHSISKTNRVDIVSTDKKQLPGPGNYEYNKGFGKDAKSFQIRGKPNEVTQNDIPGPGYYDPNFNTIKDKVQSCQIKESSSINNNDNQGRNTNSNNIGPGYYNPNSDHKIQSFTIGGRLNDTNRNDSPGPGKYNANDSQIKYKSPSHSISKTNRVDIVSPSQKDQPGPGNYEQQQRFGSDGKSFQIRGKPNNDRLNDSPGPGYYDPNSNIIKDRNPSHSISNIHEDFDKRGRLNYSNSKDNVIGPGFYDAKKPYHIPSFDFTGKPIDNSDNGIPGPGYYDANANVIKDKIQSAFIGSPNRNSVSQQI